MHADKMPRGSHLPKFIACSAVKPGNGRIDGSDGLKRRFNLFAGLPALLLCHIFGIITLPQLSLKFFGTPFPVFGIDRRRNIFAEKIGAVHRIPRLRNPDRRLFSDSVGGHTVLRPA